MLRNADPKTRFMIAGANLCLFTGLMLRLFVHPESRNMNYAIHFVFGVLLGISIALNLYAVRRRKHAGSVNC